MMIIIMIMSPVLLLLPFFFLLLLLLPSLSLSLFYSSNLSSSVHLLLLLFLSTSTSFNSLVCSSPTCALTCPYTCALSLLLPPAHTSLLHIPLISTNNISNLHTTYIFLYIRLCHFLEPFLSTGFTAGLLWFSCLITLWIPGFPASSTPTD